MYYEPTLLFRQNAIRRWNPELSPIASSESVHRIRMPHQSPDDTRVLDQSCALERLDIESSYWKIPDDDIHLTAIAVDSHPVTDTASVAISSGRNESNLFIYDLDTRSHRLCHSSTISLANTYALQWVPTTNNDRWLVTGNSKGYAHLVQIPQASGDDVEEAAFICKRFNHRKHLKKAHQSAHSVRQLAMFDADPSRLISLYDNHLFYWDMRTSQSQAKPAPVSIATVGGLAGFDPMPANDCVVSMCGTFGVSLLDVRESPKFQIPQTASLQRHQLAASTVRWNPENSNVFASGHKDDAVRLWDIRKDGCYATLNGHTGPITALQWTGGDLYSGGSDGNLVHWDLTEDNANLEQCTLRQGLQSVAFDPLTNSVDATATQRQCGTVLPASHTTIVGMAAIEASESTKVVTIDGSALFGVHAKRHTEEKLFYTEDDLSLITASAASNSTLVAEDDKLEEVVEPLHLSKPRGPVSLDNSSSETLTEHETGKEFGERKSSVFGSPTSRVFSDTESLSTAPSEHLDWGTAALSAVKCI
ncbi:protein Dse1p [Diutina catenulata]